MKNFWVFVEVKGPDECWPWLGRTSDAGYGKLPDGRRAHVVAYALTHGEQPKGTIHRHSCDNPPCCNPGHILPGTQKQNIADMVERGRHGRSSISLEQRQKICGLYAQGLSILVLAERFAVGRRVIRAELKKRDLLKRK